MDPRHHKDLLRFISFFNAAVNNIRLYSAHHPQAKRYLETAHDLLTDLFRISPEITFILVEDDLVVGRTPLRSREPHPIQFANILRSNGLERLTFRSGLPLEAFSSFILECAQPEKPLCIQRSLLHWGKST